MYLVPAVEADEQPLEVMKVSEGALNNPAGTAESGAVLGLATSDLRRIPRLRSSRRYLSWS
jgi:hypothetical protein